MAGLLTTQPRRNIAVFIDGTWNVGNSSSPTNVRKLFEATPKIRTGAVEQHCLYVQGVGTKPKFDDQNWIDQDYAAQLKLLLGREFPGRVPDFLRSWVGGGAGKGTAARIRGAYQFICRHYRERSLDRVFLFGFSRGAFAVRSLAGFLNHVGLLLADHLEHVEEAWELYEKARDPRQSRLRRFLRDLTGQEVVTSDSTAYVPMHFLGVWDTVASLGIPSRRGWLWAPFTEFHQVDVPPAVLTARHAVAAHELRGLFEVLLWKDNSHEDLQQVWFPGAHADVGGGYKTGQTKLSDTALRWLTKEAVSHGLIIDDRAGWTLQPNALDAVHHEIRGLFLASAPTPRRWLGSTDELQSHFVHQSLADYLVRFRPTYDFRWGFVSAALRRVDELALQRAVQGRLSGKGIVQ